MPTRGGAPNVLRLAATSLTQLADRSRRSPALAAWDYAGNAIHVWTVRNEESASPAQW